MAKTIKIVYIDDSPELCEFVKAMLEGEGGFTVVVNTNPVQAEEVVLREKTDLLLLDIVMPQRSGTDVIAAFEKNPNTKKVPIVVVSGKGEMVFHPKRHDFKWEPNNPLAKQRGNLPDFKRATEMAKAYGVEDYVAKPFTPDLLIQVIRDVYRRMQESEESEDDDSGDMIF